MGVHNKNKFNFKGNIDVIVSKKTCSSGELLASIFIGRDNTRIIGMNCGYDVGDKIQIILTILLVTTYDGKFHPQEVITVDKTMKKLNKK